MSFCVSVSFAFSDCDSATNEVDLILIELKFNYGIVGAADAPDVDVIVVDAG